MMELCWIALAVLAMAGSPCLTAEIMDPSECTSFPCMIFEDNFDFLDADVWEHEINMAGGGNSEFQVYVNNRTVSYTKEGLLYIKPELTSDWKGEEFITSGDMDLWGMNGINDVCTGQRLNGCRRQGTPDQIIKPTMSARMRTLGNFAFRYGRMEFRAKMPSGDWIWPAVWLMPSRFPYGPWPASGEVDILETRGNLDYGDLSNRHASCAIHAGPYEGLDQGLGGSYDAPAGPGLTDDFNIWTFEWTDEFMSIAVNGEVILDADPITNFYDNGNFAEVNSDNPWQGAGKMAPFDKEFYLILNVAIGGTGYFPDDIPSETTKPWSNDSPTPDKDFYEAVNEWYPTWTHGESGGTSEQAALQIDYIRIYKMSADQI